MFSHRSDGVGDNTKLRPFFPRMHQTDRMVYGIDHENGAAIGDVNAKANTFLICDQAITTIETLITCRGRIDDADAFFMHLLRGDERRAAKSMGLPDFPVNAVQPGERFRFIVRQLDLGNTKSETVNNAAQRAERRELFSGKRTRVHLPEVVRECLVWTGGLIPALFSSSGGGFGAGDGLASVLNFCRVFGSSSLFE